MRDIFLDSFIVFVSGVISCSINRTEVPLLVLLHDDARRALHGLGTDATHFVLFPLEMMYSRSPVFYIEEV